MPIVEGAPSEQLKRLLQLYPVASLRERWPDAKGKKEDICAYVAEHRPRAELIEFVSSDFSCCKQHVHIYPHDGPIHKLPKMVLPNGSHVHGVEGEPQIYLIKVRFSVVLKNPPESAETEFLWPARIEIINNHLIVRFVTMEKDLSSYFDGRPLWVSGQSVTRDQVLRKVTDHFAGNLMQPDLHKGIKRLWADGFMDCPRAKYKKTHSTASEIMDEGKGIRHSNPELYEILKASLLLSALFQIDPASACTVSAVYTFPAEGSLVFPRYSSRKGDTDHVIREILRNNK